MKPTPEHSPAPEGRPLDAPAPVNPSVAYEAEDVSVGAVERAGVILVIVILASLAVVGGTLYLYTRQQPAAQGHELPPAPRMQGIPGDTLAPPEQQRQFQAAAAAELNGYGWVDAQHNVAHIPIEEAMKMLTMQGLPQPAAPGGAPNHGAPAAATGKKGS